MDISVHITEDKLLQAVEASMFGMESQGFCVACGAEHEGVEPDAENYECHTCGEDKVFGAEQILLMTVA